MENRYIPIVPFESYMLRREAIAALLYLPIHLFLIPMILGVLMARGIMSVTQANFALYAVGAVFIVLMCMSFLRRDFDPLCDKPIYMLSQVLGHYGLMMLMNLAVNPVLMLLAAGLDNPNDAVIIGMSDMEPGLLAAFAVFLCPIMEEVIFRGAIFGCLRKKSRVAAYIVCIVIFSFYHVWSYMLLDWHLVIFVLQYLPTAFLLCRIYERTGSIWGSIFLHMMINGIALKAVSFLEGMA